MLVHALTLACAGALLPGHVFQTIAAGRVAVVDDFLSTSQVAALRDDASSLFSAGSYSAPTRDVGLDSGRSVLREADWSDFSRGDGRAREAFSSILAATRADLASGLFRPDLVLDQPHRHEVSYTRFGPGASLKRHIDEHHEETKGVQGWRANSRRSVSWLVYLNPQWDASKQGGEIRVFERRGTAAGGVGATPGGDLQVGWLRRTPADPFERAVFLDSRRPGGGGNCALRCVDASGDYAVLTRDFFAEPLLFLATDLPEQLQFRDFGLARRFQKLEEVATRLRPMQDLDANDYNFREIAPAAGRLVLFDSVAVPHEVLATRGNDARFALSGWFHQDQQSLHKPS
ncbi:hypothetical protein M885DRAFT_509914 [Pelagophyceae sp. CCMP2097]|nr:hypothetical protein M885DRAFT_509914 [Pelagophyceae sp. CCMP2097]